MTRSILPVLTLAGIGALCAPAAATPMQYGTGLSSPAATIDFSGLSDGTVIGDIYISQGVRFGSLVVTSQLGSTAAPSVAPAAANFEGMTVTSTFSIDFTSPVHDVAFFLYTDGFTTTITSSLDGATVESTTAGAYSNTGADYFGFTGSTFDRITLSVSGTGTAVIDNVELGQLAAVPEPETGALLLAGVAGIFGVRRRRA